MTKEDIEEFNINWDDETKDAYWDKHFESDYYLAKAQALKELGDHIVPPDVLEILTELKFNMGDKGFSKKTWPKFFSYLLAKDLDKAAYELLHNGSGGPSKWLKDVGSRAEKIANELRNLA